MEQDISGPSIKAGHVSRQKMFSTSHPYYYPSNVILLEPLTNSPLTIILQTEREETSYYTRMICFSLHSLCHQIGSQKQLKPHMVQKKLLFRDQFV